jgi:hypothetical protein
VVNQQMPHDPRGEPEKVAAVTHLNTRRVHQLEIRFVHERRGVQRPIRLASEPLMRELSHTVVDQRDKLVEGLGIALPPATEELRDISGGRQSISVGRIAGTTSKEAAFDSTPGTTPVKRLTGPAR